MMSMSGRRPNRGSWLQLIVLRIIYEQPLHGYKLLEAINTLLAGRRKLKLGSLYTMLRRMERANLLDSTWEQRSNGLDRRIYTLTENGIDTLNRGKQMVEDQRKILDEMTTFYNQYFTEDSDEPTKSNHSE